MISVALCTYNGEDFIEEQLLSILTQSLPVDEIIVCDDISTDNTVVIIKTLQASFPSIIKLFINDKNLGARKNFESAISLCNGDYIFLSDQDDIWDFEKVAYTLTRFIEKKDIWGVFTDGNLINEQGQLFKATLWDSISFDNEIQKQANIENMFKVLLHWGNISVGATMCIRKEAKELILPFQLMNTMWHDEWIAFVLANDKKLDYINKRLINYRLHNKQQVGVRIYNIENNKPWFMKMKQMFNDEYSNIDLQLCLYYYYEQFKKLQLLNNHILVDLYYILRAKNNFYNFKRSFLLSKNLFLRKLWIFKWIVKKEYNSRLKDLLIY